MSVSLCNKLFLIVGHKVDGLGDIASAMHLANALHERAFIPINRLFVATNAPEDAKLFNSHDIRVLDYGEFKRIKERVQFTLTIISSCCAFFDVIDHVIGDTPAEKIPPCLCIYEYGFLNRAINVGQKFITASCGLKDEQIGIMVYPELWQWATSEEGQDPVQKMNEVLNISEGLRTVVLQNRDPVQFVEKSRLYFAYPYNDQMAFDYITAIVSLYQESSKKLVFVIPSFNTSNRSLLRELKGWLLGIPFEILDYNKETGSVKVIDSSQRGNPDSKLTLISGKIAHKDLIYLAKAAEKETVITGDQSFEAASLDKCIVYDTRPHKTTLRKSLKELSDGGCFTTNPEKEKSYQTEMIEFFEKERGTNYKKSHSFNERIVREKNCLPRVIELMERGIAMSETPSDWINLRGKTDWNPLEDIPFDIPVLISWEQVRKLCIRDERAEFPGLEDSLFKARELTQDYYLIERRHAT